MSELDNNNNIEKQDDGIDADDGLYTGEEPQRTGDTTYLKATSAKAWGNMRKIDTKFGKQKQGNHISKATIGLVIGLTIMILSALVAIIWYQKEGSGYCKESSPGCGWKQLGVVVTMTPIFLIGLITSVVSTMAVVVYINRKTITKSRQKSDYNTTTDGVAGSVWYVLGLITGVVGITALCIGCCNFILLNNKGALLPLLIGIILTLVAIFCFAIKRDMNEADNKNTEEPLNSKTSQTPSQQTGDTPSVVKEDWETKERNKIEKNRISAITGLITMAVAVIIFSIVFAMAMPSCFNGGRCASFMIFYIAWIPLLVLFLAGFITAIVNAIIYFAHKNKNKNLYEQQGNTENNIKQKAKSSKSLVITLWVLGIILGIIGMVTIIFGLQEFTGLTSSVFYIFAAIVIALSVPFFVVAANETKRK